MDGTCCSQTKALLVRNFLIKIRARRTFLIELFTPLIYLVVPVIIFVYINMYELPPILPHPGILESFRIFDRFLLIRNHTIAVAPNTSETQEFLKAVNNMYMKVQTEQDGAEGKPQTPINFLMFNNNEELSDSYWKEPQSFQLGLVFEDDQPISSNLKYEIRGNPQFSVTPPTTDMFSDSDSCLGQGPIKRQWSGIFPDPGETCPAQQYYLSGFLPLQTLVDFTKITLDSGVSDLSIPGIMLELLPRSVRETKLTPLEEAATLKDLILLILVPVLMVMAMSQYTTYLIVLIVNEKENHSLAAMKTMGVKDSAYWFAWFVIYTVLVAALALVVVLLLYLSDILPRSSYTLLFLNVTAYGCSSIMITFVLSTFFNNARTAGLLASFVTTLLSLVFLLETGLDVHSTAGKCILGLLSPLAFAKVLYLAIAMEMNGVGLTWVTMWEGPQPTPGVYFLLQFVDILLYGLLAYYLDNVLPNEHSIRRSPLFFLNPMFWCNKKSVRATATANGEPFTYLTTEETESGDIEPVPPELKGREAIRIEDLHKTFNTCFKPGVKAVNGINLTIYEGQITAILGHNGAGKTTLFNILLGCTAPTSGTAYIYGYDIRNANDMQVVRRMTGVCPQFDILFKTLTAREHLHFYGTVRGIPASKLDYEIEHTLADLDLLEKADFVSANLSGGQKRKLCIGIAIIGDPKIIVLDEPSAGVDPISRRHIWSVLQSRKAGKVILLTTHFMDEADILAERKAVISKGRIRCCGSSLFLKNKFGIGYHLTLVLQSDAHEVAIAQLVQRYVHRAERARRHGRELSFILPHNAVNSFPDLFAAIEREVNTKRGLGVTSYGVAMTTLEEVFLHLERDEDEAETNTVMENLSRSMLRNRAMSRSLSIPSKSTSYHSLQNEAAASTVTTDSEINTAAFDASKPNGEVTNLSQASAYLPLSSCEGPPPVKSKKSLEKTSSEPAPTTPDNRKHAGFFVEDGTLSPTEHPLRLPIEVCPNNTQKLFAMVKLRFWCLIRDTYKLVNLVAVPVLLSMLLLYRSAGHNRPPEMPSLRLDGGTYTSMKVALIASDFAGRESPQTDLLLGGLNEAQATGVDVYTGNASQVNLTSPHLLRLKMALGDEQENPGAIQVSAAYNDTAQHSLPIVMNLITNSIYRMVMANKRGRDIARNTQPIITKSHPFDRQNTSSTVLSYALTAFSVGFTFIMVAATAGVDMVYDREIRAKTQMRVNGLSFPIYFISFFIVMFVVLLIVFILLVLVAYLCGVAWLDTLPAVTIFGILMSLFCPCAIILATTLSYCFHKTESAASILPGVMLFPGIIPYFTIVFVKSHKVKEVLHIINSLLNPFYLPFGAVWQMIDRYLICMESTRCRREGNPFSNYNTKDIGVIIAGSIITLVVWSFILFVVDLKSTGASLRDRFRGVRGSVGACDGGESLDCGELCGDDDVRAERSKVSRLMVDPPDQPPVVIVQNLRKEYDKDRVQSKCCDCCVVKGKTHKLALKELSLAIDTGEVFGLLGHNGAGKTTTMKIIIAEEAASRGRVQIAGYDIATNMNEAFQKLGYCPQHDAQWKKISCREHLELYAAIRGVPSKDIPRLSDAFLAGLQMKEHANKPAAACSGGTRRKLSFAMSMVGNPAVVLMDEPSTGMDPRSKRFLWDTILASFQGTRGAILTTHAMEEADALCSRVGIMVKGELKCIGPTQHLKNLYGAGYTLEMKLKDLSSIKTVSERHEGVLAYVTNLFKDSKIVESFSDRLVFEIPQKDVSSVAQCFRNLEKAKRDLNIIEYSFSQTTLEQVFLKFSHDDGDEDD
ncbi:cholesterol transporter ABCA5 isoform X3 [Frankliniella occidentalis]|nr:cholesterol transporter ABCA5 isoform X3 [Frankliniella occidentalis]XP_052124178.1 cholesterol transporter ABCA5 isoform X3 [Frankliniella occidentalis]XP_052124179.1 cholesterol transporter ABCA5 isoform X3 [Frankliniella occidentalis]